MSQLVIDNAKIMPKGQITLPKEIREELGVSEGDRVTLISENGRVIMVNAAEYALRILRETFADVAPVSDEEAVRLAKEARSELA